MPKEVPWVIKTTVLKAGKELEQLEIYRPIAFWVCYRLLGRLITTEYQLFSMPELNKVVSAQVKIAAIRFFRSHIVHHKNEAAEVWLIYLQLMSV